jgi:hypothetical protein
MIYDHVYYVYIMIYLTCFIDHYIYDLLYISWYATDLLFKGIDSYHLYVYIYII